MHLHEFLAHAHDIYQPKVYLEVGVQHGHSLKLAHRAQVAIGVDPQPLIGPTGNQVLFSMESDAFFGMTPLLEPGQPGYAPGAVDLGFVDGLHHAEQALRDFLNIADRLSDNGVIVIDDVLPRNQAEASRVQCPGDWTGDVWKMAARLYRAHTVEAMFVNTSPTGVMVVTGASKHALAMLREDVDELAHRWKRDDAVPDWILFREQAWEPDTALEELKGMR